MATEIGGVTFFQSGLTYQVRHSRKLIQFSPRIAQLFQQRQVFTQLTSPRTRFTAGDVLTVSQNVSIEPFATFPVGDRFYPMGAFSYSRSLLPVNTIVGRYSSIATGVERMGANHPMQRFSTSIVTYEQHSAALNAYLATQSGSAQLHAAPPAVDLPVVIGNDVWIGQDVTFSSAGIVVNDGAVVAANAIVTKDVPPYAVVAGNPARIVKYRFPFATIQQLLELKWWQYDPGQFSTVCGDDAIDEFIAKLQALKAAGQLHPFEPRPVTLADFSE